MNQQVGERNMYSCGECQRIVWLMEPGSSDQLKCCDKTMQKMSEQEKKQYLRDSDILPPEFMKPGSP